MRRRGRGRVQVMQEKIKVATWNVGTLTGRSGEVVRVLEKRRVDLCCLQETRWKGEGTKKLGGYKLFWKGVEQGNAAVGGVGILVAEKWRPRIVEIMRVDVRVLLVKLIIGKHLVSIVSAYAPSSSHSEMEKDRFWEILQDTMTKVSGSEIVIWAGDFNGHVGRERDGFEGVHGGFGFGHRNEEGGRILEYCASMDMVLCNTMFKKVEKDLVTYESGDDRSMIDYVMVKRRDRKMVTNVRRIWAKDCVPQHCLLITDMKVGPRIKSKKQFHPKLKIWKLKEGNTRLEYVKRLEESEAEVRGSMDVDTQWKNMEKACLKAAESVCGWTKGPARHKETWWWNDDVEEAVNTKRMCYDRWWKTDLHSDRAIYEEARKKCNKACAVAQQGKLNELATELESEDGKKKVFNIAKQMAKERQDVTGVNCLKNSKGQIVTDPEEIKGIWKVYMEKLLNEENIWDGNVDSDVKHGAACEISRAEVEKALRKMKPGKAAGPTGVTAEMLQAGGEIGLGWLTELCNTIIREGQMPTDWKRSILMPVYKGKGDPMECGSYRAIKLLEHAMKVVERVIERRIREQAHVDEMQFGFRSGSGTTDAIFILRQLQEKHRAKSKQMHYAFVDLEKAFDRVPREVTKWAMRKLGVEEWLISTVMAMYDGVETVVRTADGDSESFKVKVGLHQGSVLSPLLFIMVMEVVTRDIRIGLPWELLYADDLVLTSDTEIGLKQKIMKWKASMESKGLKVNVGKTKVMISGERKEVVAPAVKFPCSVCNKGVRSNCIQCNKCNKWVHKKCSGVKGSLMKVSAQFVCKTCNKATPIIIETATKMDIGDGVELEQVGQFCYLGDMLDARGGVDLAVSTRVGCAWKKFRELAPFLTSKGVSLRLKGKVYESCVRSCMIYGSETWAMKKEHERQLQKTEMRMIRWMCGVSLRERKTNVELRDRVGIEDIAIVCRRGRLRWFGHVERKDDDAWVKKCTRLEVDGVRQRGRPQKTWRDVVVSDMKAVGLKIGDAQDRERWRRSVCSYKPANQGFP